MSMILLVGFAMLMWKCQTNEDESLIVENQIEQSTRIINKISFKDLPSNLRKDIRLLDRQTTESRGSYEELLFINEDQIIAVTDSLANTK